MTNQIVYKRKNQKKRWWKTFRRRQLSINEKHNKEEESKSNKGESIVESESSEAESEIANREAEINSLKTEIKELRNDIKFWMENIASPLKIISNSIMAYQIPKIGNAPLVNNKPYENNRQEINQSEVVEHEKENYEAIRERHPYELLFNRSCCQT